ncbi:pyrroline-5-carboxylate reductase [Celeribacter halophilus]|uniref:pyrroline-5-carboxylate reductase n=1 Tax=Celeribacter halophilus TaxID=576117 RepID=UPI0026E48A16|nr:pyrroline-5-carboxylate reductase [Celeribacter halophilus]MDO6723404.1 pyrroline-5-carboxylate reductase [Celeribacter halophilus]
MTKLHLNRVNAGGLVLFGCGKMGSALLQGWLEAGVQPNAITVLDPRPSDWLLGLQKDGLKINAKLDVPTVCVLAVKPQIIAAAHSLSGPRFAETLFVSVAAGTTLSALGEILGPEPAVIRTMPNTPAAIGQGITALVGNARCRTEDLALAEVLMSTVGQVVRLESETQIDAVTGVSGSGPAYVFHFIECLAAAGEAEGLTREVAIQLAKATVAGAGALAQESNEAVSTLRENVTSPAGTTAAGLSVLMSEDSGLLTLVRDAVRAATVRSIELGAG